MWTTTAISTRWPSRCHRAALVAPRHHLEEQIGLLPSHRQITDLIDDQKPVGIDRAMHHLPIAALPLGRFQHQDQVSCAEEARLVAALRGQVTERDRKMSLADTGRNRHILLSFHVQL